MTQIEAATSAGTAVSRTTIEDFLFQEARLLDNWKLKEWLALFSPDGRYRVAPAGAEDEVDPFQKLFYVDDDHFTLTERVLRLYKPAAHAEQPHSKCRRMVSNVEILASNGAKLVACANYIAFRTKFGQTDMFPGHYLYDLDATDGHIQIDRKTVFLDIGNLYEQAKVSIIL
jgi:p-cumate 2,3-dioxygenase beta subunit